MTTKVNERALVLEMLLAVNEEGQYSHLVLRDVLDKYQYLGKQERAFLTRLMEGTLERQLTLDYVIDQFSKTRVKKMKPLIRNLMRMSVYQIMYMDSVPDSAVCNEAVKLARKRGFSGLSGFVNGVLRSVARGWREVRFPNLSVTYSMPEWIVDIWTENYGEEKTRQILEGLTAENRLTIRTNLSAVTPEELVNKLKSEGVTVHAVPEMQCGKRMERSSLPESERYIFDAGMDRGHMDRKLWRGKDPSDSGGTYRRKPADDPYQSFRCDTGRTRKQT